MKFIYTKHAEDKLKTKESKKFIITRKKIEKVISSPSAKAVLSTGVVRSTGKLDRDHSLCVAYKRDKRNIKIITFFPSQKGRYENKVL